MADSRVVRTEDLLKNFHLQDQRQPGTCINKYTWAVRDTWFLLTIIIKLPWIVNGPRCGLLFEAYSFTKSWNSKTGLVSGISSSSDWAGWSVWEQNYKHHRKCFCIFTIRDLKGVGKLNMQNISRFVDMRAKTERSDSMLIEVFIFNLILLIIKRSYIATSRLWDVLEKDGGISRAAIRCFATFQNYFRNLCWYFHAAGCTEFQYYAEAWIEKTTPA